MSFRQVRSSLWNIILKFFQRVRYCSAPYGICVEDFLTITTTYSIDNELNLLIDVDGNQLADGFYLLQIQIQDSFLALSNNVTQCIILDQTKPLVELESAIEQIVESELVVVDVNVSDEYTGSDSSLHGRSSNLTTHHVQSLIAKFCRTIVSNLKSKNLVHTR